MVNPKTETKTTIKINPVTIGLWYFSICTSNFCNYGLWSHCSVLSWNVPGKKLDTHQCHCHINVGNGILRVTPAISTYFVTNAKT
jgi:hypothetical protein